MGSDSAKQTALITGGTGFLGRAMINQLLEQGYKVRNYSRSSAPDLEKRGVEMHSGDLQDLPSLEKAMRGCDVVFHVAARVGFWGDEQEFVRVNVRGTENVIAACRSTGVKRLVFTSSPSVVFDGSDMENVDESAPYPKHFHAYYPKTKALAEQAVRAANDAQLATVSLRPHLIWGPNDTHLTDGILQRGKKGRLRKIGFAAKKADFTFVEDVARAHLLAAEKLKPGSVVAGKTYFISQDEPLAIWDFADRVLRAADLPPTGKAVPVFLAYALASLSELSFFLLHSLGLMKNKEPNLTRFLVNELSTAHWFNIDAAKKDLGYLPQSNMNEAFEKLRRSFQSEK